jgi:hypothetical protein
MGRRGYLGGQALAGGASRVSSREITAPWPAARDVWGADALGERGRPHSHRRFREAMRDATRSETRPRVAVAGRGVSSASGVEPTRAAW